MGKHAYLIMVHEQSYVLESLLRLLDNELNDIFIHIDKKSTSVDENELRKFVSHSKLVFLKKFKVFWGDDSLMKTTVALLKNALKYGGGGYSYIHLLSGADLPLMAQSKVHDFFDVNNGREFIHFGTEQYQEGIKGRYDVYHFFSKYLGRNRKEPWVTLETYSLAIQRRLKISRSEKSGLKYYGGANWFSITGEFAKYIVENFYKVYWKHFRLGQNLDEYAMQTMIMNSPFKNNLYLKGLNDDYKGCMRYIDWERGNPYVFRSEDFEDLINSGFLFARKFDEKVDREIVERLYNYVRIKE